GVDAAGIFDPSIAGFGPQVINYTYTTPDGCVNSTTQNVTIFDVPVVTLNTFTDTCISTADFALYGGFPITDANGIGVYSGTGVDGLGVFSPADAGVGTHLITYTYTTALGGCVSIATQNVVVDSLPIVTFTSFIDTCTTVIPFTLSGGLPLGGIYSGIGITANVFNPLTVGADTIQLTYTYTDSHGCSAFATDSSIVVAAPIVSFTSFTDTCISVLPFSLTGGLPAGGVYSGLGVNSGTGIFDPMIAGAGSDTLVYTYTDITGCSNIAKDTVVVNALPIVTITTFADTCINIPAFNLFGGLPAGGTYSGIGVNSGTGIFDPMIAGAGNDTIFYTYTDLNGCANVDSQTVVVFAAPIPNAGPDIEICFGMDTVITASGGLFYQWTPATGLNASNIANPIASPDLTTTYIVAVSNAQGCIASDTMVLTVHPLPIVNAGKDTVICFGNSVVLNASATGTLTYVWTPSDSLSNDSIFNPIANPTTSITYLISVIDSNGCVGTDNISIGVKPLPFVELNSDAENNTTYTGEVVTFTSTPAGYVNYQFFVNGSSMLNGTGNLYLTSALENGQLVNVIVTENGCSNSSDTLLMTVRDLPNAFTPNGDSQNDRFAKGIDLEVFNRWGQLIYKGIDGWDGKFNGKVVAPETYFYVATLYDVSDNKTVKKGTISVVAK
ncbi:MAG: gliding motility-associated C-terminal domain-containing protein, partial [Bacteroidetes bacterium]|nr:gliding motility-associated C-terminal domain-containing protein [Bacteroidota bacterium]